MLQACRLLNRVTASVVDKLCLIEAKLNYHQQAAQGHLQEIAGAPTRITEVINKTSSVLDVICTRILNPRLKIHIMDPPNKLFKHNNGTSTPARWFDLEAFNQWSEQIINKCDILHTRPHRARATTSDAHPCLSAQLLGLFLLMLLSHLLRGVHLAHKGVWVLLLLLMHHHK